VEVPGIVPSRELPLGMVPARSPVTVQLTAVFVVPVTEALMDNCWPTVTAAGLEGLVIEIFTVDAGLTVKSTDFEAPPPGAGFVTTTG